jgi:hypothetical protein
MMDELEKIDQEQKKKQKVKYMALAVLLLATAGVFFACNTSSPDWAAIAILLLILSSTYTRVLEFLLALPMSVLTSRGNLRRWGTVGTDKKVTRILYFVFYTILSAGAIWFFLSGYYKTI